MLTERSSDMKDDDNALFLDEMQGVSRLAQDKVLLKPQTQRQPGQDYRRQRAVRETLRDRNPFTLEAIDLIDPHALLSFKRNGVQDGVYRKLRLGQYPIQGRLDLHRMTVAEARSALFSFIEQSQHEGRRTLLVLHGKGERNPSAPAKLKSYVNCWLPDHTPVLAMHSAQPQHGGLGAVYVLLRKNKEQKQDTREHHLKR